MSNAEAAQTLAAELRTLTAEQRAALARMLSSEGIDLVQCQAIEPRSPGSALPLSYQQQRLWFLAEMEGANPTYNITFALQIEGELDRIALEQSIQSIVARHEILRTRLPATAGVPEQVVDVHGAPVSFETVDGEDDLRTRCAQEVLRPFELKSEPLFRARVLSLGATQHALLINMHHCVSDGWSLAIFIAELTHFYNARHAGRRPALPPLQVQYGDYALWQREWLSPEMLEARLEYWRAKLANVPALLELPTDRPRPAIKTYGGAMQRWSLPARLPERLNQIGQRHGTTLYMTMLAAFYVLLHRYTGQSEIAVGTPVANRNRAELEQLIGFFANTAVMHATVTPQLRFLDLLLQVKNTAIDAQANDVPFEQLVERLNPERSLSFSPLFQVMFALQNMPVSQVALDGVQVARIDFEAVTSKFDLTLFIHETDAALEGAVEYSTELFEAATIERFIGHYQRILEQIVDDPCVTIASLDYLTALEKQRLLVEWNATAQEFPGPQTLHELFAAQAERTPHNIAVKDAHGQLSYRELYLRAKRLAYELSRYHVYKDELVGVVVSKSCSQVVAVMGVLMSAAAYLPVDVDWPMDRQNAVLVAGRCRVIITCTEICAQARWPSEMVVLDVDALPQVSERSIEEFALPVVAPTDLAYVIFTSGSTGAPKGVMIEHAAAANTIVDINARFEVTGRDSVLALSSLAFDLSVYDIFGLLAAGGCVVLPRDEDRVNPSQWLALLVEHGITLWDTVPGVFQMLIDFLENEPARQAALAQLQLRIALLSGDWLPVELPRRAKRLMPDLHLISLGGATEASIWSNSYPIHDVSVQRRSIPYGKPLANQRFYILDESLQPCGTGVPGYLHIGGVGVARGYWEDAPQTASKFFYHEGLRERIYCTGDLGRWQADGNMEFLGRRDGQVKIRGFRIELGEIESRLAKHPAVRACVVVAREDTPGDKRLVAYVVTDADQAGTSDVNLPLSLRGHLEQSLPHYMIPSAFVLLDCLPLTANGKVDRKKLIAPGDASIVRQEFVPPAGELEQQLAALWEDALGVRPVGATDNFFSIGGHSLIAMRLVSSINQSAPTKITLRDIFRYPTVRDLAALLQGARSSIQSNDNPQLLKAGTTAPLFFVHHVFGDADAYAPLANLLDSRLPVYAVHVLDRDPATLQDMSMRQLAAEHAQAILKVQTEGPYRLAGHSAGGLFACEIASELEEAGADVQFVGLIDTHDMAEEPLQWQDAPMLDFIMARIKTYNPALDQAAMSQIAARAQGNAEMLLEQAQQSGWIPEEWDYASAEIQKRRMSALFKLIHGYRPPVTRAHMQLFAAADSLAKYPMLRWSQRMFGSLTLHVVEGDHGSIMYPPHARALARVLAGQLQKLDRTGRDEQI